MMTCLENAPYDHKGPCDGFKYPRIARGQVKYFEN